MLGKILLFKSNILMTSLIHWCNQHRVTISNLILLLTQQKKIFIAMTAVNSVAAFINVAAIVLKLVFNYHGHLAQMQPNSVLVLNLIWTKSHQSALKWTTQVKLDWLINKDYAMVMKCWFYWVGIGKCCGFFFVIIGFQFF